MFRLSKKIFILPLISAVLFCPFEPVLVLGEEAAAVKTGDAASVASMENQVNVNDASVQPQETEEGSSQDPDTPIDDWGPFEPDSPDLTDENHNVAEISNSIENDTGTGNNSAGFGGAGDAFVVTGEASSSANILNIANFNIYNSEGFFLLLDALYGDLDFSGLNFTGGSSTCSVCTNGSSLSSVLSNDNYANITNDVIVRAMTGGNSASSTSGNAIIETGDAYAYANVVNIANTNIANSNYLMMVVNNPGSWGGNIVLPDANFFENFFLGSGPTSVSNTNAADIMNTVTAEADTGGNDAAASDGGGFIETGDANTSVNIVNQANQNIFGGGSLVLLFRVFGSWTGSVFNAPPGVLWTETPLGVEIMSSGGGVQADGAEFALGGNTDIANNNIATINNNIQVYALTGDNKVSASGTGTEAIISTGNAYAAANVLNIANTNVYGRNWILAIINIFGDWSGSVSFGQPNLWIGGVAETNGNVGPGSDVTYHFTVANRGNAPAHNVKLSGVFNYPLMRWNTDSEEALFTIGTVPARSSLDVSYTARVSRELPSGAIPIELTAKLSLAEPDQDLSDNIDVISIVLGSAALASAGGGRVVTYTPDPDITITKENNLHGAPVSASSTVEYTLVVKNNGGEAYHAYLYDSLFTDYGDHIATKRWNLETIKPHEEITITYDVNFSSTTPPGVYINMAQVYAVGRHPSLNPLYGVLYESADATSSVVVLGNLDGSWGFEEEILRTSTGAAAIPVPTLKNLSGTTAAFTSKAKLVIEEAFPMIVAEAVAYDMPETLEEASPKDLASRSAFLQAVGAFNLFAFLLLTLFLIIVLMLPDEIMLEKRDR
jgi:hypothetical protein